MRERKTHLVLGAPTRKQKANFEFLDTVGCG